MTDSAAALRPAVLIERCDHVLVVTLNRPEARNAVNAQVSQGVGDALHEAQHDPTVRVVVVTGTGQSFCAGADLKAVARGEDIHHAEHREWGFAGYVQHFIDKPTIAAINGSALGGGTELALASDLIVAEAQSRFGLPEVKRGLIAGGGGVFRIVEQLPRKLAMELLFTGDPMTATEALEWGLINRIAPHGEALEVALGLAGRIAANAPLSVRASKRVAYGIDPGDQSPGTESAAWERTTREASALFSTHDCGEGLLAFAEKRPPVWKAS